jgi:hypothetical protein
MCYLVTVNDGETLIPVGNQQEHRSTGVSVPWNSVIDMFRMLCRCITDLSNAETVDLPLAMPPVSPTTRMMVCPFGCKVGRNGGAVSEMQSMEKGTVQQCMNVPKV